MNSDRRGFTLLEISIVVVVIGLIIGGIFVGRELVKGAELRAVVSQIEKFNSSTNVFKEKYNALPGDLTTTQATSLTFKPLDRTFSNGNYRHGNGRIDDMYYDTASYSNPNAFQAGLALDGEVVEFWQDLSSANMIEGNFSSLTVDGYQFGPLTFTAFDPFKYMPEVKMSTRAHWGLITILPLKKTFYTISQLVPKAGNWPSWTGYAYPDARTSNKATLTPIQAQAIDTKLDDGLPNNGRIMASVPYVYQVMTLPLYGDTHCATAAIPGIYQTRLYPNEVICNLIIETQF